MGATKPELRSPGGPDDEQGARLMRYLAFMLLAGCAHVPQGDFCDIARPKYFTSAETINWLADNDRRLLAQIVAENEIYRDFCL
jgi:hypothetical protein